MKSTKPADVPTQNAKNPGFIAESRLIAQLTPYAKNSRTHSDAQIDQVAASIREWGFTSPVLIDDKNMILAGHGRVMAAKKLGMPEVPVIVARNWTAAQKRAYVIADNKLALNAGWDSELLALELQDLSGIEFDVEKTGFEGDELDALLGDIQPQEDTGKDPAALATKYLLMIEVASEADQAALFDELQSRVLNIKVMN